MSANSQAVNLTIESGRASLTLNRPEKRNAFDDGVIAELLQALDTIRSKADSIRVVNLTAVGKHFCAGADLGWMKRMAELNYEDNLRDARQLATLMETLDQLPLPVIARVQGAAFGGALGLIACSDIVIASEDAKFCLSEVKLGLAPATISPYVVKAIGERNSRRYFLSAEVFDAREARDMGLVHVVQANEQLDSEVDRISEAIQQNGPRACLAAKQLIHDLAKPARDYMDMTSKLIAELRVSAEGQEGLSAFFDKRDPGWRKP